MRGRVRLMRPCRAQNMTRSSPLSLAALMSSDLSVEAGAMKNGNRRSSGQVSSSASRIRSPLTLRLNVESVKVILSISLMSVRSTAPLTVFVIIVAFCWAMSCVTASSVAANRHVFFIILILLCKVDRYYSFILVASEPILTMKTPDPSVDRFSWSSPSSTGGVGRLRPSRL